MASGLCEVPKLDNDRYPIKFEDAIPTIRKAYQEFEESQKKKSKDSFVTSAAIGSVAVALVAVGAWYFVNK